MSIARPGRLFGKRHRSFRRIYGDPAVVIDASGRTVVAWTGVPGPDRTASVYALHVDRAGNVAGPRLLSWGEGRDCADPLLFAIDRRVIATWRCAYSSGQRPRHPIGEMAVLGP